VRTTLAVLALVLGLAGCGGETTEEDKVRSALVDFSRALADADGDKACKLMTDEFKLLFAGNTDTNAKDCSAAVRTAAAALDKPTADALRAVEVTDVKITGETATAKVARSQGVNDTQPLRKLSGKWLVDRN
jgi:hypothetical protein